MRFMKLGRFVSILAVLVGMTSSASASSHREAPGIAEDPYADNTDTYLFISPEDQNRVVVVANYVPLLAPASGPNFYRFSDNVLYEIRFDNNGDAVPDISYEFKFTTTLVRSDTFLYNLNTVTSLSDPDLNVKQTYTLTRRNLATGVGTVLGTAIPAAPWDVGQRSFPGATGYTTVANAAVQTNMGTTTFAGPRRESFAVDFNVFDLLGVGPGATGLARANYATNFNVMTLAISIPITDLVVGGTRPAAGAASSGSTILGAYATASRRQVTILRNLAGRTLAAAGRPTDRAGQWVQVSRLAIPLVNEVLVPLSKKDDFNRTSPAQDASNFGMGILNPELNGLLIGVLPALGCTATPAGGNATLAGVVQGNLISTGFDATIADLLRINIRAGQTHAQSGFPNGRRIQDDVFSVEVNVICNRTTTGPATPVSCTGPAATPCSIQSAAGIGGALPTDISGTFPYMPAPIRPN